MPCDYQDETIIAVIARTAYGVNRAYCIAIDDVAPPPWSLASEQVKAGYMLGAKAKMEANLTPEQQHQLWCKTKLDQGWTYGKYKDEVLKYHPNLVTYAELPEQQKIKDQLFQGVVDSFKDQK